MATDGAGADVSVGSVKELKDNWEKWSDDHREYQKRNPFSNGRAMTVHPQQGQDGYGRPPEGSRTEQRGKDAHCHVGREVYELCEIIRAIGETRDNGRTTVEFGRLFDRYLTVSNKVVGILLRARKQRLVHFEGEMLWQGRDDRVLVTLLQQCPSPVIAAPEEIKERAPNKRKTTSVVK